MLLNELSKKLISGDVDRTKPIKVDVGNDGNLTFSNKA